MAEIEAKFLVDNADQFVQLVDTVKTEGLIIEPVGSLDVLDRYLDTADWQIFRAGWAYRWRNASEKRKIGLKSVATREGAIQEREEVEQKVDTFPEDAHGIPDGQVRHRLNEIVHGKLHELFQVRNNRRLFHIQTAEGALVELAIDDATITPIMPPKKSAPGQLKFAEVELELKSGTQQDLQAVANKFSAQFGLMPSRMSKFERGLQTVGRSPPKYLPEIARLLDESTVLSELRDYPLAKGDAAIDLAYRHLLEQFEAMLSAEPWAWEGLHPDGVRRMCVATRQIRAAFQAFKRLLPPESTSALDGEFKWVASRLSDVRELDVHRDELQYFMTEVSADNADDDLELLAYSRYLAGQWQQAREDLIRCLSSQRYRTIKGEFGIYLLNGVSEIASQETRSVSIADEASRLARKRYKRVLRHGRKITKDSPAKDLDELRLDCQRLRHLLEVVSPIYGKQLDVCIKPLKRLQGVLDAFQDACVAQAKLRCYAEARMSAVDEGELPTLGRLIHTQQAQADKQRAGFRAAWKRFDRKGRQQEILACLR